MDLIQKAKNLGCEIKNNEYYLWEIQKFFREKHNIYIEISVQEAEIVANWYWSIYTHTEIGKGLIWIKEDSNSFVWATYEKALKAALQQALILIKNK